MRNSADGADIFNILFKVVFISEVGVDTPRVTYSGHAVLAQTCHWQITSLSRLAFILRSRCRITITLKCHFRSESTIMGGSPEVPTDFMRRKL